MSLEQSFRVDGVQITIHAEAIASSSMREFMYHGRAVTAVAREFAESGDNA